MEDGDEPHPQGDVVTLDEYNKKFESNTRYSGHGFETRLHMPCPGCAEPDWLSYRILEVEDALAKGATCKHCGRGFKAVFEANPHSKSFRLVQTCGADLPEFLPKIERVDE